MAVIWAIVHPQHPSTTEDEFCAAINGDVLQAARDALGEALLDFFPNQRTSLSRLLEVMKSAHEKLARVMTEGAELICPRINDTLDAALDQLRTDLARSGMPSTASPDTWAATGGR